MNILTPDLIALIPATILIFAAEHLILSALAEHYAWAHLPKPASYTLGVSTLFGLFLVHAALNGHLEAWGAFAILTGAAGVTVKVLWVINPKAEQLEAGPFGELRAGPTGVDLTNSTYTHTHVVALMEHLAAFMAQIQMGNERSADAADMMHAYFQVMRKNPHMDPDVPVAVIRRWLAKEMGREKAA